MLLITCVRRRFEQDEQKERGTYPRFEIDENGTRNVVLVVGLVKKHVFAIAAFSRPFFEDAFFVDPVFGTESLPVHGAHLMRSPSYHDQLGTRRGVLWFPHCPS